MSFEEGRRDVCKFVQEPHSEPARAAGGRVVALWRAGGWAGPSDRGCPRGSLDHVCFHAVTRVPLGASPVFSAPNTLRALDPWTDTGWTWEGPGPAWMQFPFPGTLLITPSSLWLPSCVFVDGLCCGYGVQLPAGQGAVPPRGQWQNVFSAEPLTLGAGTATSKAPHAYWMSDLPEGMNDSGKAQSRSAPGARPGPWGRDGPVGECHPLLHDQRREMLGLSPTGLCSV